MPATFDRFAEISVASVEGLADFFSPEGLTGFLKGTFNSENEIVAEEVGSQAESEDERLLSMRTRCIGTRIIDCCCFYGKIANES